MSAERDGRRVSAVLTEARTVLSRAETAHAQVLRYAGHEDPASAEVLAALEAATRALEPFARTSTSGCSNCGAPGRPHKVFPRADFPRYWEGVFSCEVPRG